MLSQRPSERCSEAGSFEVFVSRVHDEVYRALALTLRDRARHSFDRHASYTVMQYVSGAS